MFRCALCQGCLGMRNALRKNFDGITWYVIVGSIDERFKIEFPILTKNDLCAKHQHFGIPEFPDVVIGNFSFVIGDGIQKYDSSPSSYSSTISQKFFALAKGASFN